MPGKSIGTSFQASFNSKYLSKTYVFIRWDKCNICLWNGNKYVVKKCFFFE